MSTSARSRVLGSMLAPGERASVKVARGRGTRLVLADGRHVLDAGSMSSCLLGHCHPEVVAAIQAAAETVYVNDTVGYEPRERAAAQLLEMTFAEERWTDSVVWFVSSSEAADLGLVLAQMLTGREPLVARVNGYHGAVGLAREASLNPLWDASLAGGPGAGQPRPRLSEVRALPMPVCGSHSLAAFHDCATSCLCDADELLTGAAAVIMDCSQGGTVPSAAYVDGLAAIARKQGVLWLADETVTGFGRVGRWFAFQRGQARPAMVTLGKGLTGGAVPGGALVLSAQVVEAVAERRWLTSSTFRGNPLTIAAISTVLKVIGRDRLIERSARLGAALGRDLQALAARHRCVRGVVGEGLMWFVRLNGAEVSGEPGPCLPSALITAAMVSQGALDRGVLIPSYGSDSVWLVPPLVISEDELAAIIEVLDAALTDADRSLENATVTVR
jgi:4-aminobutyrate aminotransferase-like enzyme